MKTALEAWHSTVRQERMIRDFAVATIIVAALCLFLSGCTVSDLDLHVREGALGDAKMNGTKVPVVPPAVAPLP